MRGRTADGRTPARRPPAREGSAAREGDFPPRLLRSVSFFSRRYRAATTGRAGVIHTRRRGRRAQTAKDAATRPKPEHAGTALKLPPLDLGKETLGERLSRIRKEKGVTQVELADRVGIAQNPVSAYECGRLRLQAEMVIRFARELGVSADELLGLKRTAEETGTIRNRRLRRCVLEIEKLPRRDQEALLRTIEAFLAMEG